MENTVYDLITREVARRRDALVDTRRHVYMHPELSGQEEETGRFIARRLQALGLAVRENVGGYGVTGLLRGGRPGSTVGWRADIDALPLQDALTAPYRSRVDGVKHGCGHDLHTAVALGLAEALAAVRDRLHGDVLFVFQPCEEGGQGAYAMMRDGVFSPTRPVEIHGLHQNIRYHGGGYLQAGELLLQHSTALFGVDYIVVDAAFARDGTGLAAEAQGITGVLNGLNEYHIPYAENPGQQCPGVRVQGLIAAPDEKSLSLRALYRFGTIACRDSVRAELQRRLDVYAAQSGTAVNVRLEKTIPPVYNRACEAQWAEAALRPILGDKLVVEHTVHPPGGNDDFAVFQNDTGAGLFFFLGAANVQKGIVADLHTPEFDIDEDCIAFGVQTMAYFLCRRLEALAGA